MQPVYYNATVQSIRQALALLLLDAEIAQMVRALVQLLAGALEAIVHNATRQSLRLSQTLQNIYIDL